MTRPTPPTGTGKLAYLLRWMYDGIIANELTSVVGGELKHSRSGTQLIIKPGKGGVPGAAGMTFKGEYVRTLAYSKDDVVVVYDGASEGTYVCVRDRAAGANDPVVKSDPQHGTYWMALPMNPTVGKWV